MIRPPPNSPLFPYTTLSRSIGAMGCSGKQGPADDPAPDRIGPGKRKREVERFELSGIPRAAERDRKSTRLNSSHLVISYAVFCLKKKKRLHRIPLSERCRAL